MIIYFIIYINDGDRTRCVVFFKSISFYVDLENDQDENFNCVRKVLRDELEDVNAEKLVNMNGFLDDIQIPYISQDTREVEIINNLLREYFFNLFKEKNE